jgi:hypothetical protein
VISLEQWKREVEAARRDLDQRANRVSQALGSKVLTASLDSNNVELVEITSFNTWQPTGLALDFGTNSGRVLVCISAACYASEVESILGYRIISDAGVVVEHSRECGVINDRRSPHSEFDRIKNGMFMHRHELDTGLEYTLELWLFVATNETLYGAEEARISAITATVRELL